jgi:ATP-dependent Lon protease
MDFDDLLNESGELPVDSDLFESELLSIDHTLPERLYIIPIRYRPIFPGIVTPLVISQGRFTDAIDKVLKKSRTIGLVLIKDDEKDEVNPDDLFRFGTAAKIIKKVNLPDGGVNVLINSIRRFKIQNVSYEKKYLIADIEYLSDESESKKNIEIKALMREVLGQLKKLSDNNPLFTEEMKLTMLNVDEPGKVADFVTSILNVEKDEYQEILETLSVKKRLWKVLRLLQKEIEVLEVQKKIQVQISDKIEKQQKEFFLREQLKVIKQELGLDVDERTRELLEMKSSLDDLDIIDEVREKIADEIHKLGLMETSSSEYSVTRTYIDMVLSLPWNLKTEDKIIIDKAEKILNRDHYGLKDVKERILEFLAVKKIKPDSKGSIICLLGPPGVGKTSLGRSIAKALNRKFFRISLGGMRDEAEIKGHRRTYIGAMPGKIIQGIRICKSSNPVFMLDEIDKLGQSFQGDPASALLEVLDPEQNSEFRDYYMDVPFNLSDVLFVTTANTLDTIPPVLIDRMEVINLPGYIALEKYQIARRYLLPKQIGMHGLKKGSIAINRDEFMYIINGWAREAGVRSLERQIERICRKSASIVAKGKKLPSAPLSRKKIREYLGLETFTDDDLIKISRPGVAVGLAWTSLGGSALVVESIVVFSKKGIGELKLTGQLGDVMSESANIAYSYIQNLLDDDSRARDIFNKNVIHIHVPAGATPKDGPSAGITIASSIYSVVTGKRLKKGIAMTGELTLTGRVLPVGGLKEKIIAAKKASLKSIILPRDNSRDLDEISENIKKGLKFLLVDEIDQVISAAFEKNPVKKKN